VQKQHWCCAKAARSDPSKWPLHSCALDVLRPEPLLPDEERSSSPECATGGEDRLKPRDEFQSHRELADVMITPVVRQHTRIQPSTRRAESDRHFAQRPVLIQAKLTLENQHITLVLTESDLAYPDLEATLRSNGVTRTLVGV